MTAVSEPPGGPESAMAASMDRVLRAYGQVPAGYQRSRWQLIPDAGVTGRWRERLRALPTAGLDTTAMTMASAVARQCGRGSGQGSDRQDPAELVALAAALDAEMRRRGYLRPAAAYTDGWHYAPLLAITPDPARVLARVPDDDILRGINDGATHQVGPEPGPQCRYRELAVLAQREREARAGRISRQSGAIPAPTVGDGTPPAATGKPPSPGERELWLNSCLSGNLS